jgi:hypothetical protein
MEYHTLKSWDTISSHYRFSTQEHHERGFTTYARKQLSANHVPAQSAATGN